MNYLILGFFTGVSLILAIGAQNIFVIEQGLKKNFIFIVCLICALSDIILIFFGIFLFHYFFDYFTPNIELILNISLLIFLLYFIFEKIKNTKKSVRLNSLDKKYSFSQIIYRTLGFTYLNPHVYSDTVFFLGNFSKDLLINQKLFFGIGSSISSILFFFLLGYLSKFLSKYLNNVKVWKYINIFIILFMSVLASFVAINIIK